MVRWPSAALVALGLALPCLAADGWRDDPWVKQLETGSTQEKLEAALQLKHWQPPSAAAVAALGRAAKGADAAVAIASANALHDLGAKAAAAAPDLVSCARGAAADAVYSTCVHALAKVAPDKPDSVALFAAASKSHRKGAHNAAVWGYTNAAMAENDDAVRALALWMTSKDSNDWGGGQWAFGFMEKEKHAVPWAGLVKLLRTENPAFSAVPRGVLAAFAELRENLADASGGLVDILKNGDPFAREGAAKAIGLMAHPDEESLAALVAAVASDKDDATAHAAGESLAGFTPETLPLLTDLLASDDATVRLRAAQALNYVRPASRKAAAKALSPLVTNAKECTLVRIAGAKTLEGLGVAEGRAALKTYGAQAKRDAVDDPPGCP